MAYQNVPVSNGYQVVQQIANFAATIGWTVHRSEVRAADTNYWLTTISPGPNMGYLTLIGDTYIVYVTGHRGLDVTKDWDIQPGSYSVRGDAKSYCRAELRVNPILSVHLFGGLSPAPYLYAAVELEPGYYRHITLGCFQKFGAFTGGLFFDCSNTTPQFGNRRDFSEFNHYPLVYNAQTNWHDYIRGGFDGQDRAGNPKWYSFSSGQPSGYLVAGHWGLNLEAQMVGSPIRFNGRTPLVPPFVMGSTDSQYVPVGTAAAMRYVSMEYFSAGDEMVVGSDTWKLFPFIRKKTPGRAFSTEPSSEGSKNFGIAYLKV